MATRWTLLVLLLGAILTRAAMAGGPPEHRKNQIRAAIPDKPQVAPGKPRRVLIWNTPAHLQDKDPHGNWWRPTATFAFMELGRKSGAYEPVLSNDPSVFAPGGLDRFDAIILNNACNEWIHPTEELAARLGGTVEEVEARMRKTFTDFIKGGKGLFAIHFAVGANRKWPEFREILGATMWGHPWNEEVGIKVEEPNHPVLAAFGGKDFRLAEEVFQFNDPYSRKKLRVLLSLDTANTNMGVKWIHRKDNDFGLAWVRPYGQGRVFYTALGHRTEIYTNPVMLRFYLDAIQFATGDLEAPMTPR